MTPFGISEFELEGNSHLEMFCKNGALFLTEHLRWLLLLLRTLCFLWKILKQKTWNIQNFEKSWSNIFESLCKCCVNMWWLSNNYGTVFFRFFCFNFLRNFYRSFKIFAITLFHWVKGITSNIIFENTLCNFDKTSKILLISLSENTCLLAVL